MKKLFSLLAFFFIVAPALSQNQERLSVHYLDIPQNLVEDFIDFNKKRNLMLALLCGPYAIPQIVSKL